ncbi:MAG: hypothetical protein Q8M08_12415 [Bacteroidales bacterium]|nr:hypothetical protein [Bacteroidales bacterium]
MAQCCSTGSPVGASVYVGVLEKNHLRAITYFRHSYSDTYFENDHKTTENVQLSNSSFNFAGLALAYGITKRLTVEIDAGYYFDKTQNFKNINYQTQGNGLSNATFSVKYGTIVKPARQIEFTTGFGLRFPFSTNPQIIDGVQLNRDVQPSTNAFGISEMLFFNKGFPAITLRLFSINRYDYNFTDKSNYKYGNILLNSIFVSKKIVKYFFGILQFRSEWKTNDRDFANKNEKGDSRVINSGYYLFTVSPQLSYSIAGKWNLTAIYDLPLYKFYKGKQMTPAYSVAVSLTRDFDLGKSNRGGEIVTRDK